MMHVAEGLPLLQHVQHRIVRVVEFPLDHRAFQDPKSYHLCHRWRLDKRDAFNLSEISWKFPIDESYFPLDV